MGEVDMGQAIAVLTHRVDVLEGMPPRVDVLEKQVAEFAHRIVNVEDKLDGVAREGHQTNTRVKETNHKVDELIRGVELVQAMTKGGVLVASSLAAITSFIATWAWRAGYFG